MKKYIFTGIASLMLTTCLASPDGYVIRGNIKGAGNGVVVITQMKSNNGEGVAGDTVMMKAGEFGFEGKLDVPARMSFQVCPQKGKSASFTVIAENNKITLDGQWDKVQETYGYRGLREVVIKGSLNHQVYEKYHGVSGELQKLPENNEYVELQKRLDELHRTDADAYYKLREESEAIISRFINKVRQQQMEIIRANRDVLVVAEFFKFFADDLALADLEKEFDALAPEVKNSDFAKDIREEIANRRSVAPGQPAPDFSLETPDGNRMSLSDLRGKYVVLDFWASWCRPCRASFPEMKKLYERFKDKGLEIVGITNDSRKSDWLKALEQDQLPWKQVIDEFPIKRKPAKVATMYAIPHLPTLFLIDQKGVIIGHAKDKHQLTEWLEERLGK